MCETGTHFALILDSMRKTDEKYGSHIATQQKNVLCPVLKLPTPLAVFCLFAPIAAKRNGNLRLLYEKYMASLHKIIGIA